MENAATPVTPSAVGVRYGLLIGLISIIVSFALNATGLEQSPAKWLSTAILIGGIVLAHKFFKQHNEGFLAFGQGVTIGAVLSAVVGVLSAIFSYVYMNFIDPDFATRIMDKARTDLEAQGTMSDAQVEQAMAFTVKFMNGPLMVGTVLFMILLMGVLSSLVISAVTKNPRPEFE
jgi:hypothetical protein